jgi:hypothetical protein
MAKKVQLSNGRVWNAQNAALKHFKDMLGHYADNDVVEDRQDHEDLVALLERHDEHIAETPTKIGCGIELFFRRRNVGERYSTPGFWVRRIDGSETDFSYIAAVKAQGMSMAASFAQACRMAVQADIVEAKRAFFQGHADAEGLVLCEVNFSTQAVVWVELVAVLRPRAASSPPFSQLRAS